MVDFGIALLAWNILPSKPWEHSVFFGSIVGLLGYIRLGAFHNLGYAVPIHFCTKEHRAQMTDAYLLLMASLEYIETAKALRRESAKLRQQWLTTQEACERDRELDAARYFRGEAAEEMKWFRAFDFLVKWGDGDCSHREIPSGLEAHVSEALATIDLVAIYGIEATSYTPSEFRRIE
jgi:hypothetical protein